MKHDHMPVYRNIQRNLLLLLFISHGVMALAQPGEKEKVIAELKQVSAKYKTAGFLSFEIMYRYADEKAPGRYLDSLKGSFKLNGDQYWYGMDETESIGNKEYMMMLFKEDKIMYLSKAASSVMSGNPVALIDSFILRNTDINCRFEEGKKQNRIILDFAGDGKYKRIEYRVDAGTHFLTGITCVVKSSELYDQSVRPAIDGGAEYALIEISFSGYQQKAFDESLFNMAKYFKKEGDEYITLPPYDSYKIFLGSPNL
jgi:hypothetical protein